MQIVRRRNAKKEEKNANPSNKNINYQIIVHAQCSSFAVYNCCWARILHVEVGSTHCELCEFKKKYELLIIRTAILFLSSSNFDKNKPTFVNISCAFVSCIGIENEKKTHKEKKTNKQTNNKRYY